MKPPTPTITAGSTPTPPPENRPGTPASTASVPKGGPVGETPQLVESPLEVRRPRPPGVAPGQPYLELELERPRLFNPCVWRRHTLGEGRESVWVISNSADDSRPTYPAVYLRFTTPAGFEGPLEGHRVQVQLWTQEAANAPVVTGDPAQELVVEFLVDDGEKLEGEFVSGQLLGSNQPKRFPALGAFQATSRPLTQRPEPE